MSIDIAALLLRVVADVLDERVAVVDEGSSPSTPHVYLVRLRANGRAARLVASYEWSEAQLDVGVHCTVLHDDDGETEKAAALRDLARVVRAYLNGEGQVGYRRSILPWRPKVPRYTVTINGAKWQLGRYSYSTS